MTLKIYNSLTRRKESFEPRDPKCVSMYVCGVTVYDQAHVGHAMSSLVFDMVRRYLQHKGYGVRFVKNFTDVDDKVIARASEQGVSPFDLSDQYMREFLIEMDRLNVLHADVHPRVTSEMPGIIAMVERLVVAGHAYAADNGDVYFDVSSFPEYGKLSKRPADEQVSQEPPSGFKQSPRDFALWKAAKPGEPWWESPWGRGRPGWHIECSAMVAAHLGEQIDIHGGGLDLVFPHHENEIAQSEAACACQPFARVWMHNGMLQIGDEKMSKSLGNIVPIADFLQEHEPEALRLLVLSSHYRGANTLSDESIAAAERGLDRLRGGFRPPRPSAGAAREEDVQALHRATASARTAFSDAMDDDFGTPQALAALFGLVTAINTAREAGVFGDPFEDAQETLDELGGLLGFRLSDGYSRSMSKGLEVEPFISLILELREQARERKDWEQADALRKRLGELGVGLEDTPDGTEWRYQPTD